MSRRLVGSGSVLNLNNVYITTGACVCVLCLAVRIINGFTAAPSCPVLVLFCYVGDTYQTNNCQCRIQDSACSKW